MTGINGEGTITNGGTLTVTASGANTFYGSIGGATALTMNGSGTQTLAWLNTYTGATVVSNGVLALGFNNAISSNSALTVNGGTFALNGYNDEVQSVILANGGITGAGTLTSANSFNVTNGFVGASLAGSGSLSINGSGTVTLNVANSYSGGTYINSGTLLIGSNGTLGTGPVVNNESLVFSNASSTQTNAISGSGSVTQSGSGTVVLANGSNSYSGTTTINSGTVGFTSGSTNASAAQSLGTGSSVTIGTGSSNATLLFMGTNDTLAKDINVTGSGMNTIQNGGTGSLTLSGTLTKSGTILDLTPGLGGINVTGTIAGNTGSANSDLVIDGGTNGAGTVTLASTSTYYGPTYIVNGATLYANAANAIPTTNGLSDLYLDQNNSGGTYGSGASTLLLGVNQTVGSLSGRSSSMVNLGSNVLSIAGSASGNFAGTISGAGSVFINNSGTQTFSGGNTYSGGTTITNGTIVAANPSALGSGTVTLMATAISPCSRSSISTPLFGTPPHPSSILPTQVSITSMSATR